MTILLKMKCISSWSFFSLVEKNELNRNNVGSVFVKGCQVSSKVKEGTLWGRSAAICINVAFGELGKKCGRRVR